MEILIFSKSITTLNSKNAHSSSQIFELDFANALTKYSKVTILSLAAVKSQKLKNLNLYRIDKNLINKYTICKVIEEKKIFNTENRILLLYGYDPIILKELRNVSRKYRTRLISYTFDTHLASIENKNLFKKYILGKYFNSGISQLNKIDGVILLNKDAHKELSLDIPYIVSKVGINSDQIKSQEYARRNKDLFKIIYTGSLTEYNGIEQMLQAMKYIPYDDIRLEIYGDGPMMETVNKYLMKDKRIEYRGRVSKENVDKEVQKADLLLNLRDLNHVVNKFSFPSKLIQYLASGIPILSTKVINENDFKSTVFLLNSLEPNEIAKKIIYIKNNEIAQNHKSLNAVEFVKKNYLWEEIIIDVNKYFLEQFDK